MMSSKPTFQNFCAFVWKLLHIEQCIPINVNITINSIEGFCKVVQQQPNVAFMLLLDYFLKVHIQ